MTPRPFFTFLRFAFFLLTSTILLCAEGTIKIGELNSLTGKEASFGQSAHKGIVLAIEELNAAGGVLGQPLELITEDTQTKAGEAATAARKLISRNRVVALLGDIASNRSLEAAPVAQSFKIPMITPTSTNPKVTEAGNYIFRVCFIDPFQGTVMARFAHDTLQARKVAILSSTSAAYSVGLAKFFRETFLAAGGTIALDQKYAEGDKDFRAQLTAIKAVGFDAVFVPGYYTESALIVRQARELGITQPFFGGDGWEAPQLFEIGGAALDGCYYSTHFSPANTDSAVAAFVQRFQARWDGSTPDAFAALGYDAARVLAEALTRAGTTSPAKLRDAIAATRDFAGITGKTTLDPDRNASKPATLLTIKDGRAAFLKTVAP